jgi:hypothetical protein
MSFQFLGAFLLERGLVTTDQIEEAAAYQAAANRRLGEHAVAAGLITPEQVEGLLEEQEVTDMSFGELAVARGYASKRGMDSLLFRQHVHQVHLGEALLVLGHLTPSTFSESLADYTVQEKVRRSALSGILSELCGGEILETLVGALERAFQRFAGCPVKVLGELSVEDISRMAHSFAAEAPIQGLGRLRFTLHLSPEMLILLAGVSRPEESGRSVSDVPAIICRYLEQSLAASKGVKTACAAAGPQFPRPGGDCLRLRLACPGADLGLTAVWVPEASRAAVSTR